MDKSAPSKWALERALKFNGHIECKCAVREGKSPCGFCRDMALEFDAIRRERDEVAEKLERELEKAEGQLDIILRECQGDDDASLANDYGGTGWEKEVPVATVRWHRNRWKKSNEAAENLAAEVEQYAERKGEDWRVGEGTEIMDALAAYRERNGTMTNNPTDLQAALRKACEDAAKYLPEPRGISDADVADIIERHLTPVFEALRDSMIEECAEIARPVDDVLAGVILKPERSAAMTDLEKELVEKLAIEEQRPFYGATQDIADMPIEVARKRVEVMFMPLIRSHTQALVAAAYAACAEHHPQDELDKACKCSCGVVCESWAQWEAHIRSLTPADAARELERRELEKVIEGLKTARARTLPGCRTLVNLGHVPEAVRAGEWVQMDIEGEIADVEQRLASLSKPAPVERRSR